MLPTSVQWIQTNNPQRHEGFVNSRLARSGSIEYFGDTRISKYYPNLFGAAFNVSDWDPKIHGTMRWMQVAYLVYKDDTFTAVYLKKGEYDILSESPFSSKVTESLDTLCISNHIPIDMNAPHFFTNQKNALEFAVKQAEYSNFLGRHQKLKRHYVRA